MSSDASGSIGDIGARMVTAHLDLTVFGGADLVCAVAVADGPVRRDEHFVARLEGTELQSVVVEANHGGRLHMLNGMPPGSLTVDYTVTVAGAAPAPAVSAHDRYRYALPSRYCQSDQLGPIARSEFAGLEGRPLLDAISSWVGAKLNYLPGSSRPTDGAVTTMLSREGVCRDYAHLAVALLRALGVPARVASVYAPGLVPMDFHAVAEACLDGKWWVVDPTTLAPRPSLVRIATGVDATETAFLTTLRGQVQLNDVSVTAIAEPVLPYDDLTELVALG